MCTPRRSIRQAMLAALGLALFASAIPVFAQDSGPQDDPPDRVARLSYIRGDVSFQPAGDDDWVEANLNRPLGTGDKLFTDQNARVEMEVGAATLRLDAQSNFDILNLNDTVAQTELTQGTINLHVRRVFEGQSYEVDTPTLAFVVTQPGDYRVDIAPDGTSTMVTVFKGGGDVYGENNASYSVNAGNSYRFHDASLQDYEVLDLPRGDEFDTWAESRNQRYERPTSRQYVSEEVIGAADLDDYGGWSDEPEYGHVWYPSQVEAGWAPYRDGHWAWVDPWGWTWVDNAAWGFAPFHYGRWVYTSNRWGWCPGPVAVRPVYAPALVAFVGGAGFGVGIGVSTGPVGWFPLGPRDVYVPWYHASHNYFTNVNVRNTTIVNNTYITNVYNDYSRGRPLTNVNYAYRQNVAAVTAVPRAAFVGARPVNAARVQVNEAQLRNANVATRVGIAPTRQSFVAANAQRARAVPTAQAVNRNVIARTAPPPKPAPVDRRIAAIEKNNSQPLATRQLRQIAAPAAGAAAGAAAANRGGNPRVQVVGQNGPKPQPLPARAPGAQGNRVPPGQAANANNPANNAKPGTLPNQGARTLPAQTNTPPRGQPQDRTVTRGNANEGKGNANGNPNANGLPSSRFAPHAGPQGQAPRTTGATSTPRNNAVNPADKTPNNARTLNERNANTGRAVQTPPQNAGNPNRNVQKTPPSDNNERPSTVHRATPPTATPQERNIERRTTTPPTSAQEHNVERHTPPPQQQRQVQPQREYTPRTAPVEHAPPQREMQRAPQPVERTPPQPQRQMQPQQQRQVQPQQQHRPPPQRTNERAKDKDKDKDDNGHR
jgi:hypothetical protein